MNGPTTGRAGGATAERASGRAVVEVRAEGGVGTVRLWGPCALCGRNFAVENRQTRLAARDRDGGRVGPVCYRCASAGDGGLEGGLLSRARRLKEEADKLEGWARGGVRVHPDAREAARANASAARAGCGGL